MTTQAKGSGYLKNTATGEITIPGTDTRLANIRREIDRLTEARDMFALYKIPYDRERLLHVHDALCAERDRLSR